MICDLGSLELEMLLKDMVARAGSVLGWEGGVELRRERAENVLLRKKV